MKTKLPISILLLVFSFSSSYSQTYIPMLNNSTYNLVSANFQGPENLLLTPGNDVVIGSHTYKKYSDPTPYNSDNYIREDVVAKKVYRNVAGSDQLLYDFSLQVGNTITLSDGKIYTVNSITNVNVIGGQRRMFYLIHYIGTFPGNSETWIEGVGSNRHPFKPTYEMYFSDPYIYTSCSAQNGVSIYNHGIANGQTTPTDCSMLLNTNDEIYLSNKISFSPNPFKEKLTISSTLNFENSILKIYNSIGQSVKEIKDLNGSIVTIEKEDLKSGIYLFQISQNGKIITTKKILVTD